MTYAIAGIIVIFLAGPITTFIFDVFFEAADNPVVIDID